MNPSFHNSITLSYGLDNTWGIYLNGTLLTTPDPIDTIPKALEIVRIISQILVKEWTHQNEWNNRASIANNDFPNLQPFNGEPVT